MKSPLLIFAALSFATHAAMLAWYGDAIDPGTRGQQIQVSLLSGERQVTVSASRPGNGGKVSSNQAEQASPVSTTAAKPNRDQGDSHSRDNETTSSASVSQAAVTPSSGEHISQELHRLLAARFAYPPLALRLGYQGQVLVAVAIEANGNIASATLARSSGHRILDLAAVKSVLAIRQVPQLQQWLRGRSISINVPVTYRLIET